MRRLTTEASKALAARLGQKSPKLPAAAVTPDVAHDLVFEVGWESRHVIVDVRSEAAFRRGRPKTAIHVPFDDDFDARARRDIPLDRVVVNGDSRAAKRLDELGYRAILLEGGFDAWRTQGYPVAVDGLDDDDDDADDGDPAKW